MGALDERETSTRHDETGCVFRYANVETFPKLTFTCSPPVPVLDSQRKGLEKRFQIQKYISKPDRKKLAERLGLKDSQVSEQTFEICLNCSLKTIYCK